MIRPLHRGQSGHPSPDPVTRTMTPIVTSRIAVTTVAAASFWKRVTGLLGDAMTGPADGVRPGAASGGGTPAILARGARCSDPAGVAPGHRGERIAPTGACE